MKIWRMPSSDFMPLWCSIGFDEQEEYPLFLYPHLTDSGNSQNRCYMQQTIDFRAEAQERKQLDVRATIQRKIQYINLWLDTKSEFYSRICEFNVTRRLVLRINVVTLCLCITAACVEQQPVASLVSALCAAYVVYRVNKTDKEGGKA